MEIVGETLKVPVDLVVPNTWNPNQQSDFMFQREVESIKTLGFIDDITCRVVKKGGKKRYEILDGEHRWRAAKELKMEEVSVRSLGTVPVGKAKLITQALNRIKGEDDALKRDKLIKEILDEDDAFRAVLPYTDEELEVFVEGFDWDSLGKKSRVAEEKGEHNLALRLTTEGRDIVLKAISVALQGEAQGRGEAIVHICSAYLHARERTNVEEDANTES